MASKRTSEEGKINLEVRTINKRTKHGNKEQEQQESTQHPFFRTTATRSAAYDFTFHFESLARKVCQEEIPPLLHRYLTQGSGLASTSGTRCLQLYFMNKLPKKNFTQSKIKAEGDEPLQIKLCDAENKQHIVMDKDSSMKIQICVLHGDFGSKGKEDWTSKEFDTQIVIPRKGKGQLLKGDTIIKLQNGVGYINNVEFTDISKRRTNKFRLGVKIVQATNSSGEYIREGISEPFRVLDQRGEPNKKHERPSLNDEVYHLRGIHKGGKIYVQLLSLGISTVKDYLRLYVTNEAKLREISGKLWNTTIAHAKDCDVDDDDERCYIYYAAEQPISYLVFNSIYKVVEVTFNNEPKSRSIHSLNHIEKHLVERVKQHAYKNLNDLKPFPIDTTTTHDLVETSKGVQTAQFGGQDQSLQQFGFPIDEQGQNEIGPGYVQPCIFSTSYVNEGMNNCQINDGHVPDIRELLPQNNQMEGEIHIEENMYGSQFPDVQDGFSTENLINMSPLYTTWGLGNEISFDFFDGAECSTHVNFINTAMDISSSGKTKAVWRKIRAVIKWGVSVRRVAAAKRNY